MSLTLICGDALTELRQMPQESVHCVVTSPPYFGLRDYGTAKWEGGDPACEHTVDRSGGVASSTLQGGKSSTNHQQEAAYRKVCGKCGARRIDNQLGLEPTLDAYMDRMVAVFGEVRRVLHPSGVVFCDIGDSYAGGAGRWGGYDNMPDCKQSTTRGALDQKQGAIPTGLKAKDRCLVPFRLALRLQEAGWWVRDVIAWTKPAPMPESVTDRCTQSWEPILMLTKQSRYFWDAEAVKEQSSYPDKQPYETAYKVNGERDGENANRWSGLNKIVGQPTRNLRNVWAIGPEPYTDSVKGPDGKPISHFAAFPSELPRKCILAATSARGVCPRCGEPWVRQLEKVKGENPAHRGSSFCDERDYATKHNLGNGERTAETRTIGWQPGCECGAGEPVPATVLDCFAGTSTTCAVALELGRSAIGIELNEAYCELARRRCNCVTPGLALA